MKMIKKKCPYCGADLEYHYGDHEAKCNYCKQSLIVEYEKLPFTEIKAMMDYYKEKYKRESSSWNEYDYEIVYGVDEDYFCLEQRKRIAEEYNKHCERLSNLESKINLCEQMLDEAMDDELERRKG